MERFGVDSRQRIENRDLAGTATDKTAILGRSETNGSLRVRDYRSASPFGIVTLAARARANTRQDSSGSTPSRDGGTVGASFLPSSAVQGTPDDTDEQGRRLRIVGNTYGRNGMAPRDLHPSRMSLGPIYDRRPVRRLSNSRTVPMAVEKRAAVHELERGLDHDARDRGRAASTRRRSSR